MKHTLEFDNTGLEQPVHTKRPLSMKRFPTVFPPLVTHQLSIFTSNYVHNEYFLTV